MKKKVEPSSFLQSDGYLNSKYWAMCEFDWFLSIYCHVINGTGSEEMNLEALRWEVAIWLRYSY